MAPSSQRWKSSVKEVNDRTDRFDKNINKLIKADEVMKKKIYSNPNTKVELTVKTKRPNGDWSSILSDNAGTFGNNMLKD